jgi:hypothetical protein
MGLGEEFLKPSAGEIGRMVADKIAAQLREAFGGSTNEAQAAGIGQLGDTGPLLPSIVQREQAAERDRHQDLLKRQKLEDNEKRFAERQSEEKITRTWTTVKNVAAGATAGFIAGVTVGFFIGDRIARSPRRSR